MRGPAPLGDQGADSGILCGKAIGRSVLEQRDDRSHVLVLGQHWMSPLCFLESRLVPAAAHLPLEGTDYAGKAHRYPRLPQILGPLSSCCYFMDDLRLGLASSSSARDESQSANREEAWREKGGSERYQDPEGDG